MKFAPIFMKSGTQDTFDIPVINTLRWMDKNFEKFGHKLEMCAMFMNFVTQN